MGNHHPKQQSVRRHLPRVTRPHEWPIHQKQPHPFPTHHHALPNHSSTTSSTWPPRRSPRPPQRQTRVGIVPRAHGPNRAAPSRILPRTHRGSTVVHGAQSFASSGSIDLFANCGQPRTVATYECTTTQRPRQQIIEAGPYGTRPGLVDAVGWSR